MAVVQGILGDAFFLGRFTLLGWQESFFGRYGREHGGLLHCSYFRPFKRREIRDHLNAQNFVFVYFFWIGLECTSMGHQNSGVDFV